jgi:hypothetical protein
MPLNQIFGLKEYDSLKNFVYKVAFTTFCVWIILYNFYPKYEFIDKEHRYNKITGSIYEYSNSSYMPAWNCK